MRVDLPEPLGPRMQTCSPTAIRRQRRSRATFWPRRTVMLCRSRSGGVIWESLPCEGGETEGGGFVGHDCGETKRKSCRTAWAEKGCVGGRPQEAIPTEAKTEAKKGGENVIFASRGGVGVANKALAKQQRLPCQAGLRSHSRNSNCYYVRRLTTRGLVLGIY